MKSDQVIQQHPVTRTIYRRFVKRSLDLLAGFVILMLIWPLLLLISVVLRVTIGAPVIFRQRRPGFMGRPFTIYKFRTMSNETNAAGELLPDENRATRMGQFIRSLSLDELPELFNVLKGDMSLVGPRPLLTRYLPRYSSDQLRRHVVKPGITGWAQINGRNDVSWDRKLAMDVWYVDHLSFKLDVEILIKTMWKVIRRQGISQDGQFSSSEFLGSDQENVLLPKRMTPDATAANLHTDGSQSQFPQ
jgi:sugar transferase EpsL